MYEERSNRSKEVTERKESVIERVNGRTLNKNNQSCDKNKKEYINANNILYICDSKIRK